jgi:hypothetical protein
VILIFCIGTPKVKRGRKDTPLILAVIFEKIRESVLVLEQEVLHCNSIHEVAVIMFKEELVTAEKIPSVELHWATEF